MFSEVLQKAYQQTCLEAYAKGYSDALANEDNSFNPGAYGNKLYIEHYREGFEKGMLDNSDIQEQVDELLR